jgi:3-oxoacyl-[acyl-carrier protein] reductase
VSAPLAGRRALVTGGSRGLGRAICVALAGAGARVAFTSTQGGDASRDTLVACEASGAEARHFQASVVDSAAMVSVVEALEAAWGGVDVLVNNAGVIQNLPLALIEEDDWDHVLDVNLKGAFLSSRAVLRGMIRRRSGVILNIGSVAGVRMTEAPVHYTASKAALTGLTAAMAREVARYQIRVLCLAPGLMSEGASRNLPEHRLRDFHAHCALG